MICWNADGVVIIHQELKDDDLKKGYGKIKAERSKLNELKSDAILLKGFASMLLF